MALYLLAMDPMLVPYDDDMIYWAVEFIATAKLHEA